jgi:glycosidase
MVLSRPVAALLLLLAACVTARPVQRASEPTPVALLVLVDDDETRRVGPVPESVAAGVVAALAERNLQPTMLPPTDGALAARRSTSARLQHLAASSQAPVLVLVETKARFYSLLNGRFRWELHAVLTMARRGATADATTHVLDFPVFLDFDHQREPDALEYGRRKLVDEVGRLADDFLAPAAAKSTRAASKEAIYFVMVDRYRNGDRTNDADADPADPQAFHGGDLQGVLDGLDEIQALGFTTVWLSPVFAMRTAKFEGHGAYHGYWVEDLTRVEPRFGDERLLRRLSDELHARGMKLLLDVVLNHVANDAPLARARPDWFHREGGITDWDDRHQLENGDVHGLPDLAQENPAVFEHLVAASRRWIDAVRPDGFRLDAVKHVPLAFWARYNDAIRAHAGPDFMLLGEDLDGDPARLDRTLREGRFTALFNFPLYFAAIDVFCKGAHPGRIGAVLEAEGARRGPLPYVNLVDNHDLPRLASACGGDLEKARRALDFMLVAPGIPSVSWGTEHLATGEREPHNRTDWAPGGRWQGAIRDGLATRRSLAGAAVAFTGLDEAALTISYENRAFRIGPGTFAANAPERRAFAGATTTVRLAARPDGLEEVRLTGLGEGLGAWGFERGVRFEDDGAGLAAEAPMQAGGVYQFKLVGRARGRDVWEGGRDRFLFADGEPVTVAWNG